jgi:hypothetical protein
LSGKNLVLLEVAGIVTGALIGAALHAYFSGTLTERPFVIASCVVALILFILAAVIAVLHRRLEETRTDIGTGFESINQLLTEVKNRAGVKVTLLGIKESFLDANNEIKKASKNILSVADWTRSYTPNPVVTAESHAYFKTVLEQAINRRIEYERVVQLVANTRNPITRNEQMVSHVRECIKRRNNGNTNIKVHKCNSSVNVNFLVVDDRIVFLQIDEFNESTGCYQLSRCVKLEDDAGKVASAFSKIFHDFASKPAFASMSENDL